MLRIHTTKTGSGATAVQVIYYFNRKRVIYKHIGSSKDGNELKELRVLAQDFIDNLSSINIFIKKFVQKGKI